MKFRPCIDIHNGRVKQIVGGSLEDEKEGESFAKENFVSGEDAAYYAKLYKKDGLTGGHVILLNPAGTDEYKRDLKQARDAFRVWPGGLQAGGGITAENAAEFLSMGASHVIVTSYVFQNGSIHFENLKRLVRAVGREHLVLDLSCRRPPEGKGLDPEGYYIVTNRWQAFTQERLTRVLLDRLSEYCCEFLIHAADVEGRASGIEEGVVELLGGWGRLPVTYAGGVSTMKDLEKIYRIGKNKIDVTVGSALDIFGGSLEYKGILAFLKSFL